MTPVAWIALAGLAITILLNVAGHLVAWGVLKGVVQSIDKRVAALEKEIGALGAINVSIGKIETKLDGFKDQFTALNESIAWVRQAPPPPEKPPRVRR